MLYYSRYDAFGNELYSTVSLLFDQKDPILNDEYTNAYKFFGNISFGGTTFDFIGAEIVHHLEYEAIKVNISDYIDKYITTTTAPTVCK